MRLGSLPKSPSVRHGALIHWKPLTEQVSKMKKSDLTQQKLKEIICYDHETGVFKRIVSVSPKAMAGMNAGTINDNGYLKVQINGKRYLGHRLAWFYVYGYFPTKHIDHINGVRNDNRILNLRLATIKENKQNLRKAHKNNKSSGMLGVSWHKGNGKFRAQITKDGKYKCLGYFDEKKDAYQAYIDEKRSVHPFGTL